jgi:hypothetical protein
MSHFEETIACDRNTNVIDDNWEGAIQNRFASFLQSPNRISQMPLDFAELSRRRVGSQFSLNSLSPIPMPQPCGLPWPCLPGLD